MFKTAILVTTALLLPAPALAWGQTGHRVIGAIAQPYLTRHTRHAVRRILGSESLAEASTWPDFMRASPDPFWHTEASPFHYVTVPPGRTYAATGAPPEGDAVTALTRFSATLRDPHAAPAERQLALRFIIHIVGDLHQPLHAGNGTDKGGNDVKVSFYGKDSNLHAVWDSGLIDQQQLSYTEMASWLSARISRSQARSWTTADPLIWIAESAAIRDRIYPASPVLSYDYTFTNKAIVDERLEMGGVRLAAYLNMVLR